MNWNDYIIVQAGGKGTRLGYLTANRPKCLVPVDNRPMLFHAFEQFPNSKFIIIGDTHFDVLRNYLACFASVDYALISGSGEHGTLAGMAKAFHLLPKNCPFMIMWSDLVLPEDLRFPEEAGNYIGIGESLPCRWKFENGVISEKPSSSHGIAGLFLLRDKSLLGQLPEGGQLVKFMSSFADRFQPWFINGLREFGLLAEYENLARPKCRSFNVLEFSADRVIKRPISQKGVELAKIESAWYDSVAGKGVSIPAIHSTGPLVMERVSGCALADAEVGSRAEKAALLVKFMANLAKLHSLGRKKAVESDTLKVYVDKTFERLGKARGAIPHAEQAVIRINGKLCRNPIFHTKELEALARRDMPESFHIIHGDCTFSNTMLSENGGLVFIDPRGYFGESRLYGDRAYDYAKAWYSLAGNYDNFNKKRFRVGIDKSGARIFIASNGWEFLADEFARFLPAGISMARIHFLHALIWLSLTSYVWEDYDAICCSFYYGALLFEEALNEHAL